ncbi:MAG: alpha/beta hydrolase [Deltaproteobacteria bacterium]
MAFFSGGSGPTSHTFFSQRLRLNYVDYGSADKPLMVLVHGSRDHARNWDAVAGRLVKDFHVVAPDLRGHGDSAWAVGSTYAMSEYVLDLTQLLGHIGKTPVTLLGHSLGGAVVLNYAGVYPETVSKVAAIEGLGPPPELINDDPVDKRMDNWIEEMQGMASRQPRQYATIEEAAGRMLETNPHLTKELSEHLTVHGTMRTEAGSYVWKFDNYVRAWGPQKYDYEAVTRLWSRIDCPALLVRGSESWASNPEEDGRATHFSNYSYAEVEGAAHWVHHDRFEEFMAALESFLSTP